MEKYFLIFFFLLSGILMAQPNFQVLHYTETSGWDHQTRAVSLQFFNSMPGITVTDDQSGQAFNNLSSLLNYDLIIFSNTSGNAILDSAQQSHFEAFINQGGALLGIHAATDTYRHSSANGNLTGTWDFYAETLGGSVQENPNHVAGTPNYAVSQKFWHPILSGIPDPWNKNEEYYYWENGYLDSNNIHLMEVETTLGGNNQVNSYDSSRTVAWIKQKSSGSRIFYTSLGHAPSNFTSDTLFQRLVGQAVNWCLGLSTQITEESEIKVSIHPNPTKGFLQIQLNQTAKDVELRLYTLDGKLLDSKRFSAFTYFQYQVEQDQGLYWLEIKIGSKRIQRRIIKL